MSIRRSANRHSFLVAAVDEGARPRRCLVRFIHKNRTMPANAATLATRGPMWDRRNNKKNVNPHIVDLAFILTPGNARFYRYRLTLILV